jgi:hypothetical protein
VSPAASPPSPPVDLRFLLRPLASKLSGAYAEGMCVKPVICTSSLWDPVTLAALFFLRDLPYCL